MPGPAQPYAAVVDETGRPEWRDQVWDWAPVVVVVLVSQARIGLEEPWTGTGWSLAVGGLALALPLAVRRRWPLVTCAAVGAAAFVQVAIGDSLHFGAFLAALVAVFAAARWVPAWPTSLAGLLVVLVAAIGASLLVLVPESPIDVLFPVFYIGGTFALGRVVRTLSEQAHRLRALNAALARERDTQARLSVATERLRLSRELHDVVAHRIMLMVIQAEAGEGVVDGDPTAARQAFHRIQEAGRQGLDDLRGLVRMLREDTSGTTTPRLADLDAMAAVLGEAGLEVELERRGELDDVDPALQETMFRVVQEGLTNVLKHSAADRASVVVAGGPDGLSVEVHDPGPVAINGRGGGGHGLAGIDERLAPYGGTCSAGPAESGYRLHAAVPTEADR